ncbi:MAG: membrane protein insertion efficiency factor YidD [Candidatus Theseobacter exili]|nr:membrane protein insertion efficiency factor YidD [Candidatus Theseobacter exili]
MLKTIIQSLLISLVRVYKAAISPFLGRNCRFYPSCSDYTIQAIQKHGSIKGSMMSVWRICRCNPFNKGGIDYP